MPLHHANAGQPSRRPNRLASQTSPYLLQHAFNPVDWHPWGEEAFAQARARDVPIFLSIGYSTCYWCHVMERESFEDEPTAAKMNQQFVCVKLDREERPDLDEIYMAATVMMTGHGGWPMSVFLEPDTLRPFFCGTYYPKEPRYRGMPTFSQVLDGIAHAYRAQRDDVRSQAAKLAEGVAEHVGAEQAWAGLGPEEVEQAVERLLAMCDRVQGGFGMAPKFPQVCFLEFLLDVRDVVDDATREALDACVRRTLDAMSLGGLHDHVGGGFHRYSVDATWTVPHFEKMLYDQAQMLSVYSRAATIYADAWYARVASRLLAYVRREMTVPGARGALLCSAQDAEVDHREGLNYLWTPQDVRTVLGDDAAIALGAFELGEEPNFFDPHHKDEPGRWVLRMARRPAQPWDALDRACDALLHARNGRTQPHRDDKSLACWAGLMIRAAADAGEVAQARAWLDAALATHIASDGTLMRTAREGRAHTPGFLEDYAAMIGACLACGCVDEARRLYAAARSAFFVEHSGALFDTRESQGDVFVRSRATHDGAVPSGFSMMLHAMLNFAQATGEEGPARDAALALRGQSGRIAQSPVGTVNSVRALLRFLRKDSAFARLAGIFGRERTPREGTARQTGTVPDVVQIYASVDRVTCSLDHPSELTLLVDIQDGYHVIAADAAPQDAALAASLRPFRVEVFHGEGMTAYADYPAGEAFGIAGAGTVRVYRGKFELRVALERTGEWKGTPLLRVHYQACRDDACLAARIVEIDVSLDRG